ncbi:MAG: AMP-binding protein, partial [Burkholderiales bacterium]
MNLAHLLHASAHRLPQAPALARGTRTVASYGEFSERVARLAGAMRRRGLAHGERVALAMKNCPEYYEVLFACWHAGLTAVPMNAKLHARELAYILEHSGARLSFVTPDLASAVPSGVCVASPDFGKLREAEAIPVA